MTTSEKKFAKAGPHPFWSAEEDKRVLELCQHVSGEQAWREVAERFPGRTHYAVRQRFLTLRNRAAGIKRERTDSERPIRTQKRTIVGAAPIVLQTPPDLPPPASLTAFLLGDPLPGRSALDQKRGGIA